MSQKIILLVFILAVLVSSGCIYGYGDSMKEWDEYSYNITKLLWCRGECIDEAKKNLNEIEEMSGKLDHEEWQRKLEDYEIKRDNCMIICEYTQGEQLILYYNKTDITEECEDECIPNTKTAEELESCMKGCVDQLLVRV